MIEFKSLQNRFLIHQAFVAAATAVANASVANYSGGVHQHHSQPDDLEINLMSASPSVCSSLASSPVLSTSPLDKHNDEYSANKTSMKRKFSDVDESNDEFVADGKKNCNEQAQKATSSFLISDILGLDSKKTQTNLNEPKLPHLMHYMDEFKNEKSIHDQQISNMQHSYYAELFKLLANTSAVGEHFSLRETQPISPIPIASTGDNHHNYYLSPNNNNNNTKSTNIKSSSTHCANRILSSLEQLTKSQFQDDFKSHNSFVTVKAEAKKPSSLLAISNQHVSSTKASNELKNQKEKSVGSDKKSAESTVNNNNSNLFPAWVYCTRYSDRPSAGIYFFFLNHCRQITHRPILLSHF